jgi:ankyrin repeat protein
MYKGMIPSRIYACFLFLVIPGIILSQSADSLQLNAGPELYKVDTSYFIMGNDGYNLILAAERSDLIAMEILLRRGADVNSKTFNGITALMYASENVDAEAVQMLLEYGADPAIKPSNAPNALITASKRGSYEISAMLLEYGAFVNDTDEKGLTALMYSAAYNFSDLTEMYLDWGADPSIKDGFGSDALIIASYYGSYESAKVLLEHGCDINTTDLFGFTPLIIACQQGFYDLVWLFLDKGADMSVKNKAGIDAITMAVSKDHTDIAELLIENGAKVNEPVHRGNNLLDLAKEKKNDEMVALLKSNGARTNYAPYFNMISTGPIIDFNKNEFMAGLAAGIDDSKYGTGINLMVNYRVAPIRVLVEDYDNIAFQFWERRWAATAGISKKFRFRTSAGHMFGPYLGLDVTYTWGSYRGADRQPHPATVFSPAGGFFWKKDKIGLNIKYSYRKLDIPHFSPNRISIGFLYYFNTLQEKLMFKEISWF